MALNDPTAVVSPGSRQQKTNRFINTSHNQNKLLSTDFRFYILLITDFWANILLITDFRGTLLKPSSMSYKLSTH